MSGEYRKKVDMEGLCAIDIIEVAKNNSEKEFYPADVVMDVLDCIESDLQDLIDSLKHIEGLDVIDLVKFNLSNLNGKLY